MAKNSSVKESITPQSFTAPINKEESKKKLEKFMQEELKMVKGIFQFFECPGMAAPINVKKYPGHFFSMNMQDGQEYEIPLYVARFLNGIDVTAEAISGKLNTCSYPVNSYIMDKNGNPIASPTKRKKRFGFQSLEFAGSE